MIRYVYTETLDRQTHPAGDGWEYWGDRVILDEQGQEIERAAVWRRDGDIYGHPQV